MNDSKKSPKDTGAKFDGFTEEERAAMKDRARELKAEAKRGAQRAEGESDVLASIADMPPEDRVIAERLHALIAANAPMLAPKTWYGMPAYALDGKVVCFFQNASKFKYRYATLGFTDQSNLDDGAIWPTTFAITKLTDAVEAQIIALLKTAVG
jgi:uncharacterized protein YdhG (YjbR/CyaY superfamily)